MEPNDTTWFIVYNGKYFKVRVIPRIEVPVGIELATGNDNGPSDIFKKVDFPGVEFYLYRDVHNTEITGASLYLRGD